MFVLFKYHISISRLSSILSKFLYIKLNANELKFHCREKSKLL